jgi:NAD(P)H-hydrate epimerase
MRKRERITVIPRLPTRAEAAHKGDFGTVLVVAGSRGMAGAAALVGGAALRSGAGKVRVATAAECQAVVAMSDLGLMSWPLAQDDRGRIRFQANRDELAEMAGAATVLAIGPGLGRGGEVTALVAWLLEHSRLPAVVDADALWALAEGERQHILFDRKAPTVITPHPGEFAKLTGLGIADVQADRERAALDYTADAEHLVLVLKGGGTVVADRTRVYVNTTGNPGMATAGAGDCLTGVIAALLAQKMEAFEAATLGVYVHGVAGDIVKSLGSEIAVTATEILEQLPQAFREGTDTGRESREPGGP